jgi:hypothetical protein
MVSAMKYRVVDRQIPGDGLGVGERRLLPVVVMRRILEVDEIAVVVLDESLPGCLHRALVAAVLALDRARDIDAAQLLDRVVGNPVLEHVAPGARERPEHGRHVGADRLAFRPRRAFAPAAIELGQHRRVGDGGGINIADARLRHAWLVRLRDTHVAA